MKKRRKKAAPRKKSSAGRKSAQKGLKSTLSGKDRGRIKTIYRSQVKRVNKENAAGIAQQAIDMAGELTAGGAEHVVLMARQVGLMGEMVYDSVCGDYDVPWKSVATVAGALAYFVNPWDLVPDFIPYMGYLDDAYVIHLAIEFAKEDLLEYCRSRRLSAKQYGLK